MRVRQIDRNPDHVDSIPRLRQLFPLGLQHVLVAYSGMVTVPLLIGTGIGLPPATIAALVTANVFVSGLATLLQTLGVWKVGVRYPIIMGSTFTGITPAIIIGKDGGLPAIFGATLVAGLLTVLVAPFFSRLLPLFPPVVTGTVIAIIGFSLVPSTASLITAADPVPGTGSGASLVLAASTVVLVLVLERFAPPSVSRLAVLLALLIGTCAAVPLGLIDFSSVRNADLVGFVRPFAFGTPTFGLAAVLPMLVVQFVNMVESTGDTLAIGRIVGRPTGRREVARALAADGVGTVLAGIFGSFTIVTFGENVGVVRLTRVMSRFVVALSGLILVTLGLLPVLGALVAALPGPVLGGVGVVMFGMVGAVGLGILRDADLNDGRNLLIVAVSFGLGLMPVGAPHLYEGLPAAVQTVLSSGIAAGGLAAFCLNLLFHGFGRRASTSGHPPDADSDTETETTPDTSVEDPA